MLAFGIDPGVTRTGVVVKTGPGEPPLAFATFHAAHKHRKQPAYERANGLGYLISEWIMDQVASNPKQSDDVRISIEKPIYNRNPENFALQWRLFQSILAWIASDFPDFSVLEVNPKTVKRVATGSGKATKEDMIAHSSFTGENDTLDIIDLEAIADAEGIAECVFVLPPVGDVYRVSNDFLAAEACVLGIGGLDA